jgi:uncharacterized protein
MVVLQPTTFCNIDCKYCYLPDRAQKKRMSLDVVGRVASEVFSSPLFYGEVVFLWHLGEPLSVPIEFYENAFAEIERISRENNRNYVLVFQTNATLLNSDWVSLIQRHQVRVGVSIDGPAFIHDRQRMTRSSRGTHAAVLNGVQLLKAANIPFGVIAVLTDFTLDYPDEFFGFFCEHGIEEVGFNIDELEGVHTSTSFSRDGAMQRYKHFLSRLIELADSHDGVIKLREVSKNLRTLCLQTEPYNLANKPLRILNVDSEGNFSTFCPELVAATSTKYGDFVMGNILQDSLSTLLANPVFQLVHGEVERGLALCKESCEYWAFCGGGEPSSKFFQYGRFDVTETTTCKIHKQATVDVVLGYLEKKSIQDLPRSVVNLG